MAKIAAYRIKRTPWKVDVLDRLVRVEQDIERAIGVKGWSLDKQGRECTISPVKGKKPTRELKQAEAVVTATFGYIRMTKKCLRPQDKNGQRIREWLTGELLMSVYTNLHAAETNRVLLLSSEQLRAILPTIRQRASAYLPADNACLAALNDLPDPAAPAHQALARRVQAAIIKNPPHAPARDVTPPGPDKTQNGSAGPKRLAAVAGAATAGQDSSVASHLATPDTIVPGPPASDPTAPDSPASPAPGTTAPGTAAPGTAGSAADATEANASAGTDASAGLGAAGQPGAPKPPGGSAAPRPPATEQDPDLVQFTEMLGRDQQIAAMAMGEVCRAEDLQQSEVRRFRNVLLGTFTGLFILVVVLAILGATHPKYFPLCLQSTRASSMICPTGGSTASSADIVLVMGLGGVGATLAVARNLAGLKPAGVRYSLSVAQGLLKIAFGAITAMLGIIILSTQTTVPGILGTQAGLLTTAVVFGYSQQLFTKLIDQQANELNNAASSTTKASSPSGAG